MASVLAVLGGLLPAQLAAAVSAAAPARDHHLPARPPTTFVAASRLPAGHRPAPQKGMMPGPAPVWPAAGSADVAMPAAHAAVGANAATANPAPALARAGNLPVAVGSSAVGRAHVQVLDHSLAQRAGVSGFLFQVGRADGGGAAPVTVRLDYGGFANAFGGGFASRLAVVALPACAATTPQLPACQRGTPVKFINDLAGQTLTAEVQAQAAPGNTRLAAATSSVLAVTTTSSGGSGDYKQTPLAPASTWQSGPQTGDFTWDYPFTAPPAIAGREPALGLSYSSGTTDGETAQTNPQPSQEGEGFTLTGVGFIERKYQACADEITDPASKTGDLCWAGYNAYLSLDGRTTELVQDDSSGTWRLKDDDGSRVERLTGASNFSAWGEYWRVTTTDGTQYYFGLNELPGYTGTQPLTESVWNVPVVGLNAGEPCHGATYAASVCGQTWRWNLDLVVDPNGNATEYFYTPEINSYLLGSTAAAPGSTAVQYMRGGYLTQVGYSSRASNVYAQIPMRMTLSYGDRCLAGASACSSQTTTNWPDTPWDLLCGNSACGLSGHASPTFWTGKMLTGVSSQVWEGSAGYVNVDSWALGYQFPQSPTPALWLASIQQTGQDGGSLAVPPVSIVGDGDFSDMNQPVGGVFYDSIVKFRISSITTETGSQISVKYTSDDCTGGFPAPSSDTTLCFQQWWAPGDPEENQSPIAFWFYKHMVTSVTVHDGTGASPDDQVTSYTYAGSPAWHYDGDDGLVPVKYESYGQWRGYGQVHVVSGSASETQSETDYTFMRGMDGDVLPGGARRSVTVADSLGESIADSEPLNGSVREEIDLNGPGGAEVSGTIHDPWQSAATASSVKSWGSLSAVMVDEAATRDRTDLAAGGVRRTEVDNTFDGQGLIRQSSDLGDVNAGKDQRCAVDTYVQNAAAGMLDYLSEEKVTAAPCGASGSLISDVRLSYDAGSFGASPNQGNVTEIDQWSAGDPGIADHWVPSVRAGYDGLGRVTSTQDAGGRTTTTAYSSAYGAGNATTHTTVTDPLGLVTTTDLDSGRGAELDAIDGNGKRTDLAYDPLGRVVGDWEPGQSRAAGASPNYSYSYQTDGVDPQVVTSTQLLAGGQSLSTFDIYDGLGRTRQTQEATDGGILASDTLYDSRGEVVTENNPYPVTGTPSGQLLVATQSQVPSSTVTTYDGVGRVTVSGLYSSGGLQSQTTYVYGGDRVSEMPPAGGTATTTIFDIRGRTAELDQYHGSTPTGAYDATLHTYAPAGEATTQDSAGNVWSYTYDLLGRTIQATDPDTGVSTTAYDDLDRPVSTTDARGKTLSTNYDVLDRKTAVYDTTGGVPATSANQLETWTYDSIAGAKGQLASSTSFANGNAYTTTVTGYDDAYRPTGTQITIPSVEGVLAGTYGFGSTYNVDGTPASESFPAAGGLAGETVDHTYDSLGRPATTTGTNDYVEKSQWTPDKLPQNYYLGLSQSAMWSSVNVPTYDPATRQTRQLTTGRESTNWANDSNTQYQYDQAGDVTGTNDSVGGDSQCYTQDQLGRLTQAWTSGGAPCTTQPSATSIGGPAAFWTQFSYDSTGNRKTGTTVFGPNNSVTYDMTYPAAGSPHPHAVSSMLIVSSAYGYWTETRSYDPAGNTTGITAPNKNQTLSWDGQGRLSSIADSVNNHNTSYVYDADGNVLIRRDDSSARLYLPDEEVVSTGLTTSAIRSYTHHDATVAVRTPSGVSWLAGDLNDTETGTTDASSQAVTQRLLDPFGGQRSFSPPPWPDDRGFVGGSLDPTTNFIDMGAREYDSATGRFLSPDPVLDSSDPQQMNGYAYANNNPVTDTDPSGMLMMRCGDTSGSKQYCQTHNPPAQAPKRVALKNPPPKPPAWRPMGNRYITGGNCTGSVQYCWNHQHPSAAPAPARRSASPPSVAASRRCPYTGGGRGAFEMGCTSSNLSSGGGGIPGWLKTAAKFVYHASGASDVVGCVTHPSVKGCATAAVVVGSYFIPGAGEARLAVGAERLATDELAGRVGSLAERCAVNSFAAGTLVLMEDGTKKPIEQVQAGDVVMAADPQRGVERPEPVTSVIVGHGVKHLYDITVDGSVIEATYNHPFWVVEKGDFEWAQDLVIGEHLLLADGQTASVTAVSHHDEVTTVYNLSILAIHTFFVGAQDVLVHNSCGSALRSAWRSARDKALITVYKQGAKDPSVRDLQGPSKLTPFDILRAYLAARGIHV